VAAGLWPKNLQIAGKKLFRPTHHQPGWFAYACVDNIGTTNWPFRRYRIRSVQVLATSNDNLRDHLQDGTEI